MHKRQLRVIYSQEMEALSRQLVQELLEGSPFETRLIVVPHLGIKEWLMHSLASSDLQIATGVQILPLHQAVMEIVDRADCEWGKIPAFVELALAIQEHLLAAPSKESSKKTAALSRELAHVFTRYGLFGEEVLPEWLKQEGWQQEIWKGVFSRGWTTPVECLKEIDFRGKIALFGFSYLPPVHLRFFAALGASLYLFSPCAVFWEDVVSDRERLRLGRKALKTHIAEPVREELNHYMLQSHPLLANWGALGREMARVLQQEVLEEREAYVLSDSSRLLPALQRAILTFDESEPLSCDDSIQVHSAPSKLREVEIAREVLQHYLPEEIVVVAPNLSEYVPLIQTVFASFPISIETPLSTPEGVEGFLALLNLPKERYALQSVRAVLQCSAFREKQGWTAEDVSHLHKWLQEARIAFDLHGGAQSWEEGLDRLLYGLAWNPSESWQGSSWPIDCIPHAEIELFGQFLEVFVQLQRDLHSLTEKKTLPEWLAWLLEIRERYFVGEFFTELRSLQQTFAHGSALWAFDDVYPLLETPQERRAASSMGTILFTSLLQTPLRPARVIWCLGLDEESFPRVDVGSSLCALKVGVSTTDQDRFAFLEMVMKAKEYLFFSYTRVDPRDGKERGSCLLVEELDHYLKSGLMRTHHAALSYESSPSKPFFVPSEPKEVSLVTLSQLKKCARHPLRLYFNETLQLFLDSEEDAEEFVLSRLNKGMWRKGSLALLQRKEAEGKLPLGGWKEVALYELEEEINKREAYLKQWGVGEISSVQFVDCLPQESSALIKPLLHVGPWKLQGELDGVTSQGLLFHGTTDVSDLCKVWPLYLIYLHLYPQTPYLLLTKEGVKHSLPVADPAEELHAYLTFYVEALNTPCPWIPSAGTRKEEDPYWRYLQQRGALKELEPLLDVWQPKIDALLRGIDATV